MEDEPRKLVEGRGQFVNDIHLPDTLHLAVVRSPHARARLLKVHGGINASELKATLASVGEGASEGSGAAQPVLATGYVNYVGQPVAAVLGKDLYSAIDMMDEVEVDYEPLKAVIDPEKALVAAPIHPGTKSNILASFQLGKEFNLHESPLVLEDTLVNRRISPNPLEPRGLVAQYDGSRLTVWASTQSVHAWKEGLCESMGLAPNSVRIVQVDTGGAFGSKGGIYPEYVIACYAAMKDRKAREVDRNSDGTLDGDASRQGSEGQNENSRRPGRKGARPQGRVAHRRGRIRTWHGDYGAPVDRVSDHRAICNFKRIRRRKCCLHEQSSPGTLQGCRTP